MKSKGGLIWPMLACLALPLLAAWFAYPGTHLPPKFGVFPPEFVQAPPGFNVLVFCAVALAGLVVALLIIFPRLFGFKPVAPPAPAKRAPFPFWFWMGGALTLFFWWLMWARGMPLGDLVYYAFTPLWWGFILLLDGVAYRRSGGESLLATRPKTLFISALVSVAGWLFFEYYNYFVLANWYYPNGHMPALSHATIVVLFLVAYTTVWPAVFEWYAVLMTFPAMTVRYSNGPRLPLPGGLLLWGGLALTVLMVFFPYPLFWAMWIGPLAVVAGMLIRCKVWTPFAALGEGDWGPMVLMALASLLTGFFWELWNWGSAHANPGLQTNPNYWIYDIPYVNVIHLYAEMPLLGYLGYLPFGILVWVVFIWAGEVFGFDPALRGSGAASVQRRDGSGTAPRRMQA